VVKSNYNKKNWQPVVYMKGASKLKETGLRLLNANESISYAHTTAWLWIDHWAY